IRFNPDSRAPSTALQNPSPFSPPSRSCNTRQNSRSARRTSGSLSSNKRTAEVPNRFVNAGERGVGGTVDEGEDFARRAAEGGERREERTERDMVRPRELLVVAGGDEGEGEVKVGG